MRTTFDLDDRLIKQLKKKAAEEGESLKSLVSRALRSFLRESPRKNTEFKFRPLLKNSELQQGVDVDDRDNLYGVMESELD